MDAFKSVDDKNLKKVYRSDGQGDWLKWRSGEGKKAQGTVKTNQYKRARHTPAFPKIGTNAAPDDASNFQVGSHDDVLVPENVVRKKHRHWREVLMEKEAEEKKRRESTEVDAKEEQVSPQLPQSQPQSQSLPPGWHKMTEPETGNLYYFNSNTGETSTTLPNSQEQDLQTEPQQQFIPAESYSGSKEGFVFKAGDLGLGYYADKRSQPQDTAKEPVHIPPPPPPIDPMIGTTLQPNERREPAAALTPKKLAKRKAKYGESLMDVVTRSLSEYAASHPALRPAPVQSGQQSATNPAPPSMRHPAGRAVPPPRPPPIQWQTLRK